MSGISRRSFTAAGITAAGSAWAQKKGGGAPKNTRVYKDAEIFPVVQTIIAKLLMVDEKKVVPGARFIEDLGCDSLDVVEQVMECEDRFSIDISDEDAEKIKTVQDLVMQVKQLLRNQKRLI